MDSISKFGNRVRQLRINCGWSQEELADRTGLHRTYISGVERGTRNPTITVVFKFAQAFSMSPSDLLMTKDKYETPESPAN
jgi:transcriptional regulator with XRE-family HTH domain